MGRPISRKPARTIAGSRKAYSQRGKFMSVGVRQNKDIERGPASIRLSGIEGLRGLAAGVVVFHHVASYLSGKDAGVLFEVSKLCAHGLTLFFALSGFLLFKPFVEAIIGGAAAPSLKRYAMNRAVRIYPAYIVILVTVSVFIGAAFTGGAPELNMPDPVGFIHDPVMLIVNALIIQTYVPGFILTGIGPAWSLTAEVLFYFLLPVICWCMRRLVAAGVSKWVAILTPIGVLIATGITITIWAAGLKSGLDPLAKYEASWGQTWSAVLERSFFGQADLFAYGMLAAVALVVLRTGGISMIVQPKVLITGCAVSGLVVLSLLAVPTLFGNAIGVAAGLLILGVTVPFMRQSRNRNSLASILEIAPLRYLGLISYSVYLWHVPVIWWLRERGFTAGPDPEGLLLNTVLIAFTTLALAVVTFHVLENPAMKMNRKWQKTRLVPSSFSQGRRAL